MGRGASPAPERGRQYGNLGKSTLGNSQRPCNDGGNRRPAQRGRQYLQGVHGRRAIHYDRGSSTGSVKKKGEWIWNVQVTAMQSM